MRGDGALIERVRGDGALIERVRGAGGGAENVGMGACAARTVQERPDVHKKAPTP